MIDELTVVEFVGLGISAFGLGWISGYIFTVFKRLTDFI